jgi:hypothetical protein
LGKFLCFTEQTDAFSNYHVRYCHMIIYLPQQANFEGSRKITDVTRIACLTSQRTWQPLLRRYRSR